MPNRMLNSFGYEGIGALVQSLAPSLKYQFTMPLLFMSAAGAGITRVFGVDFLAFAAMLAVFMLELISGIHASLIRGEEFSYKKLSRFSFKMVYYLLIIAISHLLSISFDMLGRSVASSIFSYMHMFLVVHIVLENIVSISENLAVVTGKKESSFINALIQKLKEKLK